MAQVRIWIHVVWVTKNREPIMSNKNKRIELFKHIKSYAKQKKIYLDFINGQSEHVHAIISLACDQTIAQVVKLLKGESAHYAKQNGLFDLELEWADEYFAVSFGQSQLETVRKYLKNQEEHHRKKTFMQECAEFLSAYGFIRMLGERHKL